jgi:metal-responsive CopG/Arc/MetJ family transcriptional regulator
MKTTLELPEDLFRKAKATAARKGQPLKQLVTEAIREKLEREKPGEKPWMKGFGALAHLHEETKRIEKIIEEEFEVIDPEGWK